MRWLWRRLLPLLGLGLAAGMLIFILRWSVAGGSTFRLAGGILKEMVAPVAGAATWVGHRGQSLWENILHMGRLQEENERLKRQVAELQGRLAQMEEYRLENERLQQVLAYRDATKERWQLKVAPVIGRNPDNWFSTLTLGIGSEEGVRQDQVVITPAGVVGRIIRVSPRTAEVLLLLDREGAVGGMVQSTRLPGVVEASSDYRGYLQMIHLAHDAPVAKNDVIVTSGLGGIFPKGLLIGTVVEVLPETGGLLKRALIAPAVDFHRLEEVMVITEVFGGVAEDAGGSLATGGDGRSDSGSHPNGILQDSRR
ncbi:rod shape-determining protein MreC [Thermanaeromonas sp. C210]|uniref:rod shape-determining protein MreC n=1 Tax=Thermanaeromonas sp. C210 TaxID=2731925 RepID=UPI00155C1813|nr:rod shape-determining protein MreC [Thermanaeromonas sp. C210]GFN22604.1 cell shape-determining protein MreC [Thermanaeromonas sp. C210]